MFLGAYGFSIDQWCWGTSSQATLWVVFAPVRVAQLPKYANAKSWQLVIRTETKMTHEVA
jgi:hypothetical protein